MGPTGYSTHTVMSGATRIKTSRRSVDVEFCFYEGHFK